jgi:hypothetical protein
MEVQEADKGESTVPVLNHGPDCEQVVPARWCLIRQDITGLERCDVPRWPPHKPARRLGAYQLEHLRPGLAGAAKCTRTGRPIPDTPRPLPGGHAVRPQGRLQRPAHPVPGQIESALAGRWLAPWLTGSPLTGAAMLPLPAVTRQNAGDRGPGCRPALADVIIGHGISNRRPVLRADSRNRLSRERGTEGECERPPR